MTTLLAAIAAGLAAAAVPSAVAFAPPAAASAPSEPAAPLDWRTLEAPLLTGHTQLTFRSRFSRAGESYFDHQTPPRWIVFQATEAPKPGEEPSPFYGMYIAKLRVNDAGAVTGMDEPLLISRPGSANTCGWFDPVNVGNVLFGSTVEPPSEENQPGFQRGTGRYRWEFPREMKIVNRVPLLLLQDMKPALETRDLPASVFSETVILGGDAYHAECSYSPDGRFILYTRMIDPAKRELHIFVFDTVLKTERPLITSPGYNGGPFFSYDGRRICFRADRNGDSLLQLYIADLKFERDASGIDVPVGIEREHQITDDGNVNWAPFWHPSGKAIVYASSAVGHRNYEIFAIETDTSKPREQLRKRRITFADGFDGLPAFSDDGRVLMWTSQRGPKIEGEERPSSQIWTATVDPEVWSNPDRLFSATEPALSTPPAPKPEATP